MADAMTLEEAAKLLRNHFDQVPLIEGGTDWTLRAVPQGIAMALLGHAERTLAAREGEPVALAGLRAMLARAEEHGWNRADMGVDVLRGFIAEADALTDERDALRAERDAIDAACLAVCPCNDPETVGAEACNDELGRYVVQGDDGEPVVDTSDPCDVIRAWAGLAGTLQESNEKLTAERDALRARVEAVRQTMRSVTVAVEVGGEYVQCVRVADVLGALEGRTDA